MHKKNYINLRKMRCEIAVSNSYGMVFSFSAKSSRCCLYYSKTKDYNPFLNLTGLSNLLGFGRFLAH